jgi:NADH:ubiquinone oxidoreductase subunit
MEDFADDTSVQSGHVQPRCNYIWLHPQHTHNTSTIPCTWDTCMHKGLATAPSKSGRLVAQFQHPGKLLCVELCHKLEILMPAKVCSVRIYTKGNSWTQTNNEKELQMHYWQVDRMGADCINSAQSKCLPKPLSWHNLSIYYRGRRMDRAMERKQWVIIIRKEGKPVSLHWS